MVVLVIIAITVSVTAVMMTDQRSGLLLQDNALRLRQKLQIAAVDAQLHGREWGMIVQPQSYDFVYYDAKSAQWQEADNPLLRRTTLPDALTLKLESANRLILPAASGLPSPDLLVLSNGQSSIFSLALTATSEEKASMRLVTDGHGGIDLVEAGHAQP